MRYESDMGQVVVVVTWVVIRLQVGRKVGLRSDRGANGPGVHAFLYFKEGIPRGIPRFTGTLCSQTSTVRKWFGQGIRLSVACVSTWVECCSRQVLFAAHGADRGADIKL